MGKGTESYRRIVRILMLSTLPVILIALVTQGSVIVDQIMFLKLSPSGRDTIVQWGVYSGKYRILANMPAVVVTAVCASLVPAISVSNASMNIGRLKEKVTDADPPVRPSGPASRCFLYRDGGYNGDRKCKAAKRNAGCRVL